MLRERDKNINIREQDKNINNITDVSANINIYKSITTEDLNFLNRVYGDVKDTLLEYEIFNLKPLDCEVLVSFWDDIYNGGVSMRIVICSKNGNKITKSININKKDDAYKILEKELPNIISDNLLSNLPSYSIKNLIEKKIQC